MNAFDTYRQISERELERRFARFLEELTENKIAVLKFGGGCQGCGMVDVTLKDGVEKTLLEQLPELSAVRDITDHSNQENAYYR